MPEYGFSLTCIFPYNDRIEDYALILENTDQESPYYGIFYVVCYMRQNMKVSFKVFSSKYRIR